MEIITNFFKPLWFVDLACLAFLLLHSIRLGIFGRYPALIFYLSIDLMLGIIGLSAGVGSLIYWWSYFILTRVLGSVLLIFMSREMFVEIYFNHPGLRGLTLATLKRSVVLGVVGALLLAPIAFIHWGEPGFWCWQLPFYELGRCLMFGQVLFIVSMWSKLHWLPLQIHKNVKTYSITLALYQAVNGLITTIVLIIHSPHSTAAFNVVVLMMSIAFYLTLTVALEKPREIPFPTCCPLPEPQLLAHASSIQHLLNQIEAAERARSLALARLKARYFPLRIRRRSSIQSS